MTGQRFSENPFYILGLRPDCSRADLEREGQKLLAMLELQMEAARSYPTPLGPMPRTADAVRQAMAELRDPQRRLLHELWAQLPAAPPAAGAASSAAAPTHKAAAVATAGVVDVSGGSEDSEPSAVPPPGPSPWPEARAALGFGVRR